MSPSWREQVTIGLSPRQVTMRRYARGLRPVLKESRMFACRAPVSGETWQPAIETLDAAMAGARGAGANIGVVLSNHFVRYLVLPWQPDLANEQEESMFARTKFLHAFGEAARDWVMKTSCAKPGQSSVGCAVESALIEALKSRLELAPFQLRSVQPFLMAACNARRKLPAGDAWIAIAESGRLLLGLMREGQWVSLRSRHLHDGTELAPIIEQEALLVGVDAGTVYLHRLGEVALDLGGLKVRDWLSDGAANRMGKAH